MRADRFYNAPDTEIDFTEQGGLMWGSQAVGKLVAGADAMKPQVDVFVDDVAGPEVAQKVQRRLQHFIDRKVAALFEPLLNLSRDEDLTGLARGFAFRMVEGLGVLPRAAVADDVKALDQDARGALRKHGIRFGQFTVFMPLLLKPAPTRLRLVLWSLVKGLDVFPESPPPGLVTIPVEAGAPEGADTMSGYRNAGDRAIRIDMLERLADMLRSENSRSGFEAKADMLSITGMTLEQFSVLMQGLGYVADKGERPKVKAVPAAAPEAAPEAADAKEASAEAPAVEAPAVEVAPETPAPEAPAPEALAPDAETPAPQADVAAEAPADAAAPAAEPAIDPAAPVEMEVFYTFTWGRPARTNSRPARTGGKPQGKENAKGDGAKRDGRGKGGPKGPRGGGGKGKPGGTQSQSFSARPPKKEKAIDPDNPFAAALMGLKNGK